MTTNSLADEVEGLCPFNPCAIDKLHKLSGRSEEEGPPLDFSGPWCSHSCASKNQPACYWPGHDLARRVREMEKQASNDRVIAHVHGFKGKP
jgi:hypothetical protein